MKYFLIALLSCAALFFACRKNIDDMNDREIGPIQPENVEAALVGRVTDTNGAAVPSARVEVAGTVLNTNNEGLFFIPKKLLDGNGTLVSVTQTGYFDAARFAFPHLNSTAYLEIQMIPKNLTTSFIASTGGTISIGQGATVTIPANAIKNQFGSDYQGAVNIYTVWLDPTSGETFRRMPGDLRGIDAEGDATLLRTFGMVGVELEGDGGQILNLSDGKKAKLVLPVPASLQADAPANIPLWHFNTANGYWEEEGGASLVNGNYEGEVSHFSFWNLDVPNAFVKLSMCFGNNDGIGIGGLYVSLQSVNFGVIGSHADDNGKISGFVPKDQTLNLSVKDRCGNIVYEAEIGPFTEDSDLGKIILANLTTVTVTGILLDCNNAPVQHGMATLSKDSQSSFFTATNSAGEFTFTLYECSAGGSMTILGYNFDDLTQSNPQTIPFPDDDVNVGTISVCTALQEYVTFTCEGYTRTFVSYPQFIESATDRAIVVAGGQGLPGGTDSTRIFLIFKDYNPVQGTASLSRVQADLVANNAILSYGCNYCDDQPCDCMPADASLVVFTSYPANIGDYAVGSFSGSVLSLQDKMLKPFSISFRVKRTN